MAVHGDREFLVKQDDGGELTRNRRFLILDKGFQDVTADLTEENPSKTSPPKKSIRFKTPIEETQEFQETQDTRRRSSRKTKKPLK